jgi:hypothetical protein
VQELDGSAEHQALYAPLAGMETGANVDQLFLGNGRRLKGEG